ncbi:tyrosine-type recombinase/integrase [Ferviditalea candida]|uniref:Tyrosine-type recombinase/integrase n=1 Tax=Ferviditalea candida TaxID=3108399 RepID=A0ABU5ZK70_9BACL|nr:tyrosine-type recombinase/integrase [Paenibacillaceae bacterium T2]
MKEVLLSTLIEQTKAAINVVGLSKKTLSNYEYEGFTPIARYFIQENQKQYCKQLALRFVLLTRQQYDQRLTYRSKYQNIRKVATMLEECYETGTVKWSCLPNWSGEQLGQHFVDILSQFVTEKTAEGIYSTATIKQYKSKILHFLLYLERNRHQDFAKVTLKDVNDYIPVAAKTHPNGMGNVISALRSFGSFLNEKHSDRIDILPVLRTIIPKRRKVHAGFTLEEAGQVLSVVDKETAIGKRDFAILTLAKNTGLRAVDITNIKFNDINWHRSEFRIVQHKTGQPLVLPLEPVVGNAIADYILHGRPESESPYIFLRSCRPYEKLDNRSASTVATRYIKRSDVATNGVQRKGMHSFRRSIGTRMLEAEIRLSIISEVLGHTHLDSAKPYLSTNEKQLRNCALGLSGIEVMKEELQ